MPPQLYRCSFCGKNNTQVKKIIMGGIPEMPKGPYGPNICDECLDLCVEILVEDDHRFSVLPYVSRSAIEELDLQPIFQRKQFSLRPNSCFLLSPFGEPFDTVYRDHVAKALAVAGMDVHRADEIFSHSVVIEDIWESINCSTFVIADVTGKNPNVMYEIGMAHTVGKPVILMTQSMDDVPFDLRHRRCIVYSYTPRGCAKLEHDLAGTVRALIDQRAETTLDNVRSDEERG